MQLFALLYVAVSVLAGLRTVSAAVREYTFQINNTVRAPDGVYREAFMVNGEDPGPAIIADEGDTIKVHVLNNLPVEISLHFHGITQTSNPWFDGVPGVSQRPIRPGRSFSYEFTTEGQYGLFWYHAHSRSYYQDGIRGSIYIRPSYGRPRPYEQITANATEIELFRSLERSPIFVNVNEWSKWTSGFIAARQDALGIDPTCSQSILVNGKGRVTCPSKEEISEAQGPARLERFKGEFDTMGCMNTSNYSPGIDHESLETPGYSKQCQLTQSDREVIHTNGSSWMLFALSNMGGDLPFAFTIDSHEMYVIAVEGAFINPQLVHQLNAPLGTRYLILVKTDKEQGVYPMRFASDSLAQVLEGVSFLSYDGEDTDLDEETEIVTERYQNIGGALLSKDYRSFNPAIAEPYDKRYRPPQGPANHTILLRTTNLEGSKWTLMENNATMPEIMEFETPLLFRTGDELINHPAVIGSQLKYGDVVDIIINNAKNGPPHPIHLHGHSFYVISSSRNTTFPYGTVEDAIKSNYSFSKAPLRDVFDYSANGHIVMRFIADNPGVWLLHCHVNAHHMGGMAVAIVEEINIARSNMVKSNMTYLRDIV
ncbi:multicopper oxidase-domain-containing protein [Dipodascopsis uninucleata]